MSGVWEIVAGLYPLVIACNVGGVEQGRAE